MWSASDCQEHEECPDDVDVYGARAVDAEYADGTFEDACAARGGEVAVQRRDRGVSTPDSADYVSSFCD